MHRLFLISQIFIILLFSGCNDQSSLIIDDLTCENQINPIGIGTPIPGLSWKIKSEENGTSQKAYQVLAASDISLLNETDADLWNSGKTESSSSNLVTYGGDPLSSKSICYWKVRIWDQNDEVSDWSQQGKFTVGLLNESDWKANYIGLQGNEPGISPLLRKSVNITEKGDHIFMFVNSLGYHEVYINGAKIGSNVLVPAVSQFTKRSLSITYDISANIIQGRNDIVIWTGKGWYTAGLPGVVNDGPLVRVQVESYSEGRWKTIVSTDSLWMGRQSGYTETGTWKPHEFGGEVVRSSMVLPDLKAQSLDQAIWNKVHVATVPAHEATPQPSEMNIISDSIRPVIIKKTGEGTWLTDMGKSLTGWVEIKFPQLKPGQEIRMDYCDHLDKDGKPVDQNQTDLYIASGRSGESFRNKFNYHGFRYLIISNLAEEPSSETITAFPIRTGYQKTSTFECSDNDLNNIHNMIFYTLQCLSLGGYLVDCPQIERLGYGGDGNASTNTAQIMFGLAPLYRNWLQAWADCIRDDGGMPHTAPNPYPAGGGPYWCGFIITASWKTYQHYGDVRVLEKYYPVMQKWLGYAEKYSSSGLLGPWPETDYRGWYLGDWASPEGVDHTNKASITLVNNCFMAVCYETMQNISIALGKIEDSDLYKDKNEQIRKLVHKELFNTSGKIYGTGSQIDMTYPLLAEIVPDSLKTVIKENLFNEIMNKRQGHVATGLVGIPVFTEWVTKEHEAGLMYTMLKKRDYPGYLYMIDNGATTTWEHWNGARSRIHNCYNGIGSWFYEAVGGIRNDEKFPGFKHVIIDPQIPEGVTWANTIKETPYGTVDVRWKLLNRKFEMSIAIPVGSDATIIIPGGGTDPELNGIKLKVTGNQVEIQSGNYNFKCNL
jgi:alpha-L-rhamnosidase